MRAFFLGLVGVVVAALASGCSGGGDTGAGAGGTGGAGGAGGDGGLAGSPYTPKAIPPLDAAALTTDVTIVPTHDVLGNVKTDPRDVDEMNKMLAMGWGDVKAGPGEQIVPTTLDGAAPPAPGPSPKLLARFVHLSDTQLADDESPARLAAFDAIGITSGAFRPHEGDECRILHAAVRTINAVNHAHPLDFVVLGGDNADNAQENELGWFLSILDGASKIECDSGADDDPVPGPDNDGKDPFVSEGLDVPWYWVTGNHDVLNQGNLQAPPQDSTAKGTRAAGGTRDWSQPGGPITNGDVPPDPRRHEMDRHEMLEKIHEAGDGHGITTDVVTYGKAFYTFDTPKGAVRFLVVDSAAETGGADGVIHQADVDAFVKPALDKALADGKLVIVTSHHCSLSISDGGDFGGTTQSDALTPQEWVDLLAGYPNVIMHLAGHTHVHRVTIATPTSGHPFWQLETAALADFPNQMKMIEIWDQDDGFVTIRAIPLDYATDGDPVAADGRRRGIVDRTSAWGYDGSGDPTQRSVDLWIAKP